MIRVVCSVGCWPLQYPSSCGALLFLEQHTVEVHEVINYFPSLTISGALNDKVLM